MVGWLCLTYHRQRGHLETAPSFTVPCEGCEGPFLQRPHHRESNHGLKQSNKKSEVHSDFFSELYLTKKKNWSVSERWPGIKQEQH